MEVVISFLMLGLLMLYEIRVSGRVLVAVWVFCALFVVRSRYIWGNGLLVLNTIPHLSLWFRRSWSTYFSTARNMHTGFAFSRSTGDFLVCLRMICLQILALQCLFGLECMETSKKSKLLYICICSEKPSNSM
jgi:hypothetical protein